MAPDPNFNMARGSGEIQYLSIRLGEGGGGRAVVILVWFHCKVNLRVTGHDIEVDQLCEYDKDKHKVLESAVA